MKRIAIPALILACAAAAPVARAEVGLTKGMSILAFQLTNGVSDIESAVAGNYIGGSQVSDVGAQVEFSHMLKEDYAFTLNVGTTLSSMTLTSSSSADADISQKISGVNVRAGGDYVAHLSPKLHLLVGPGIEWKSAKAKRDNGTAAVESNTANRIGLSGRMSALMRLSEHLGMKGFVGHHFGYASVSNPAGAKATWWSGGNFGGGGLAFSW